MLKLVALGTLILAVSVASQDPCCAPKQFMAGVGATTGLVAGGVPAAYVSYAYGAFDFGNRTFGYYVYVDSAQSSMSYRLIQNYTENAQWMIDDQRKTCEKQPTAAQSEPSNCIPKNATFNTEMTMGGKDGLETNSWTYQIQDAMVYATVVRGNCYPIGTSVIGQMNGAGETIPFVSTSGIVNMTIGIPNPDVWFKVPDFCNSKTNSVFQEVKAHHIPKFF